MPRPGGNPILKNYQFKTDRESPLTAFIGVRVSQEMKEALTSKGKGWQEFVRESIRRELMNEAEPAELDATNHLRGCGPNETPSNELEQIIKDLEVTFHSGKTLKPTDIKQLLERLRSVNMS